MIENIDDVSHMNLRSETISAPFSNRSRDFESLIYFQENNPIFNGRLGRVENALSFVTNQSA